jgi:hypothetical protein
VNLVTGFGASFAGLAFGSIGISSIFGPRTSTVNLLHSYSGESFTKRLLRQ